MMAVISPKKSAFDAAGLSTCRACGRLQERLQKVELLPKWRRKWRMCDGAHSENRLKADDARPAGGRKRVG
jgi:hypothetical protein